MLKFVMGRIQNGTEIFVSGDDTPDNIRKIVTALLVEYFDPLGPQTELESTELVICTFSPIAIDCAEGYLCSEMQDNGFQFLFFHKNGEDICITEYDEAWLKQSSLSSLFSRNRL